MMRRSVAVDMEQGDSLLSMNDGESVRYLYNGRYKGCLICCALMTTHLITIGIGVFGGLMVCQNYMDCLDDGSD